jgi:peptidoglycan/LPS O-acetylase OafA/YrhL
MPSNLVHQVAALLKLPMKSTAARSAEGFHANNFDLIRLFAASQVMLFHCAAHFGLTIPFPLSILASFPGIPIFFVTSGFLITASYDRSENVRTYLEKRALRLAPALWVCIAVTFVILYGLGYDVVSKAGAAWVGSQMMALIYTPKFMASFGFGSYNGSLWTIPLEIQFYLTVPLLSLLVARRYGQQALIGLFVLFLAIALWARIAMPSLMGYPDAEPLSVKLLRYSFIPHYFLFLAGMIAYRLRLSTHWAIAGRGLPWILAVLAFSLVQNKSAFSGVFGSLLVGGCTLACAYTPTRLRQYFGGTDVSYGVYIYHGLLVNLALCAGLHGRWTGLLLVVTASFLVALLSWHFVEKPALGFKRMLARRSLPSTANA